ncbi:MAG: glycosyltransferase family A protein [Patescibacteria group bacterium]|nr:glycosyltransferase family A protein [Patescibacteria group bacterium]
MPELISVIIPVYNHARTLRRCLFSLLKQTYRPLEVIVVNDGSQDDFSETMDEIIRSGVYKELNIRVLTQENRGAPTARNNGFASSRGAYVIFWDADTVGAPAMLAKMKAALDVNPEVSYAYSGFKFGCKKFACRSFDASALKQNNYIDVTSLIRRRDFGGFDESLKRFQDWDLWLTLLAKNKTGIFVPEILYKKIVGRRAGISRWLPGFVYLLPWKIFGLKEFEAAKQIVARKHGLQRP